MGKTNSYYVGLLKLRVSKYNLILPNSTGIAKVIIIPKNMKNRISHIL